MDLLFGRTIHPALADLYASDPPFTGHHREDSEVDLREALGLAGLSIEGVVSFDYAPWDPPATGPPALLAKAWRRVRSACEILLAAARSAD